MGDRHVQVAIFDDTVFVRLPTGDIGPPDAEHQHPQQEYLTGIFDHNLLSLLVKIDTLHRIDLNTGLIGQLVKIGIVPGVLS